mgnify:CR=1 FL=1
MLDQYMYDGKPPMAPVSPYVDVPDPIDITQTPEYQAWRQRQDQIRQMLVRQQAPPQFTPERMDPRQALIGGAVAGLARLFGARNAGASLGQYLQGVQGQVNQRNQDAYNRQMQGYQRDQFNQNRDMQVANLDERTAAEIVNQIQRRGEAVRKAAIDRNKAVSDYAQQQFENSVKLRDLAIKDRGVKLRETPKWIQLYNAYVEKGWPEDLAMQKADLESGYTLGKAKVEQTRADTEFTKTKTAGYPKDQEIRQGMLESLINDRLSNQQFRRESSALQQQKFQADEAQRAKENQFRQKDQEIRALDVNAKISGTAYKTQIDAIDLSLKRLDDELKGNQIRLNAALKEFQMEPDEAKAKVLSDQYRDLRARIAIRSKDIAAKKQILLNKKAGLMTVGGTVLPPSIQPPQN